MIQLGLKQRNLSSPTYFRYKLEVDPSSIRSMHIMGEPGYGKSTLLGNLAEQFVAEGEGVVLIDIKGDLARNVAMRTQYPDRLIYIDPYEAHLHSHYWALNPMEFDRADKGAFEFYADALPALFANIGLYDPEMMARIEKLLTEGVRLAMSTPSTTLLDVYLALHDLHHRDKLLESPYVHPLTRDYWVNTFQQLTDRDRRITIDSTDSRLRKIMGGTILNRMLIQPRSTIRFTDWLNDRMLVVINLDQGRLGEGTAINLANLFVGQLTNEARRRPPGEANTRWRIIVDEAAELATQPFARQITQMRTYSVYPIIANQHGEQFRRNPELRHAASQASVKIELRLTELDAYDLKLRRNAEAAERAMEMAEYSAHVILPKSPGDTGRRFDVDLLNWWSDPVDGQLEAALDAQLTMCDHKSRQMSMDDHPRFARLRGVMDRERHDSPPTTPKLKRTRQTTPGSSPLSQGGGSNPAGGNPDGDPGAEPAGDFPGLNQLAGMQGALFEPTEQGQRRANRRRRKKGDQSGLPPTPQGSGTGQGQADQPTPGLDCQVGAQLPDQGGTRGSEPVQSRPQPGSAPTLSTPKPPDQD